MWRYLRDPTFSHFSRTPTCGSRTDRHTTAANTRASYSIARVKATYPKTPRNFLYMLTVALARFSSDDNAIRYTSGFVDDVMFSHNEPYGALHWQ